MDKRGLKFEKLLQHVFQASNSLFQVEAVKTNRFYGQTATKFFFTGSHHIFKVEKPSSVS